jgi:nucleotide-binding universal stress UspA family protein
MTQPTPTRILVAVDDSPAALEGVRLAVDLAQHTGAQLRFVHVIVDGELLRALGKVHHDGTVVERRARDAALLLRHVEAAAERAGVPAAGVSLEGEPGPVRLDEARDWQADLLVVGRTDVARRGRRTSGRWRASCSSSVTSRSWWSRSLDRGRGPPHHGDRSVARLGVRLRIGPHLRRLRGWRLLEGSIPSQRCRHHGHRPRTSGAGPAPLVRCRVCSHRPGGRDLRSQSMP